MLTANLASPPTPWSNTLATPQIDNTAYVHDFSQIIGDVRVGPKVLIAPGTSIRADAGTPFSIGEGTNIQDGVVIHGLDQGRVIGDDNQDYSVWIGRNSSVTHKVLIQGPAYIGDDCFVGFRSTVFNARLGKGCIVMMHALVQDVAIPPGKFVPSGAIITTQEQADRLPDVKPSDAAFAQDFAGANAALLAGYRHASHGSSDPSNPKQDEPQQSHQTQSSKQYYRSYGVNEQVQSQSLTPETIQQVGQLLRQGYRIGIEYADARRYRSGVWQGGGSIQATHEPEAISALESALAEFSGKYVRIVGIDPRVKRRVMEMTIQRPDGKPVTVSSKNVPSASTSNSVSYGSYSSGSLAAEVTEQVHQLLRQGYRIGMEHADPRRYRSGVWNSCRGAQSTHEPEVIAALEACIQEHPGEYVRMLGIDSQAKRRVLEMIIQRPDGKSVSPSGQSVRIPQATNGNAANGGGYSHGQLNAEVMQQVSQLLQQGYQIGTEHADPRRYRSGVWNSCGPIQATREAEVLAALEACITEHSGEYVRMLGIDSKAKRRVMDMIIQRPGGKKASTSSNGRVDLNGASPSAAPSQNGYHANGHNGHTRLNSDILQQVGQLLNQGYRVGTEHADQRRYRSGVWQSGEQIETTRESDVIAALEACLQNHSGEYVRLVGIDPKAKRRVLETTIQKP